MVDLPHSYHTGIGLVLIKTRKNMELPSQMDNHHPSSQKAEFSRNDVIWIR